jgi:hypothetical protein
MVFAANAPRKGNTFKKFKKAALATANDHWRREEADALEDIDE